MSIGYTNNELYDLFTHGLVEKEDVRLEKQVIHGKAYKKSSLENTNNQYLSLENN